MNHTKAIRPGPLDTRQDTPMREEVYGINKSPVNGNAPHGLPTPAHDAPSSGFTAVNGESNRSSSFRPDDSARVAVNMTNGDHRNSSTSQNLSSRSLHASLGWRPDDYNGPDSERDRYQHEMSAPHKRKRVESNSAGLREDGRDGSTYSDAAESPKRRMTMLNSGGLLSQSRNSRRADSEETGLEPATAANARRAPSPIYRAGHGTPPPPPPRESEDALAKSLQATLGPRNDGDTRQDTQSVSPVDEHYDRQQSQPYGSDHAQQGDNSDPKKRKRNFSNRTKTGCHTCRGRKKKCDEGKPICENCKRGGFECGGYGPKPPGVSKISAVRSVVPLQAKHHYEYPHGPGQYFDPHTPQQHPPPPPPPPPPPQMPPRHSDPSLQHIGLGWEPPRPEPYPNSQSRYGPSTQPLPPDPRPPPPHDSWAPRPQWPAAEPSIGYMRERLPPVDFTGVPPPAPSYSHDRQAHMDPWRPPPGQPQHRAPPSGPPTVISNQSSTSTQSHRHLPAIPGPGPRDQQLPVERIKMLTGQPYLHFMDSLLIHDRASCKRAVEGYNNACSGSSTADPEERGRHFKMIRDPSTRTFSESYYKQWPGPVGECGARTIVETPFACEYGYNINLGDNILIAAGCVMEDAALISIGDRTIIGKGVTFNCMTASVDASRRDGCRGLFTAGAITVEEDCIIGAGSIILPFRTIGKGAVVGAGSVVTRDVKPYTVVAGNPAKPIRKRKIEPGPNVDRHDDAIQEENDKMLEKMRKRPLSRDQPV